MHQVLLIVLAVELTDHTVPFHQVAVGWFVVVVDLLVQQLLDQKLLN
jgi:hypothetical protein